MPYRGICQPRVNFIEYLSLGDIAQIVFVYYSGASASHKNALSANNFLPPQGARHVRFDIIKELLL